MTNDQFRNEWRGGTRGGPRGPAVRRATGRATTVVIAAGITGITGVAGAGPAAAEPTPITLKYTCSVQSFSQTAVVKIDADVPATAVVGKPTSRFAIHARAQVDSTIASGLRLIGVKSVEGTADGTVHVTAPQGGSDTTVPFTVPRTAVPGSGGFSVVATGTAPTRTFKQPGKASISVGDLTLHVVPRDANGKVHPGKTEVPCKLKPGQRNTVATFRIIGSSAPTGSPTSRGTGTTDPGTTQPTPAEGSGPTASPTPQAPTSAASASATGANPTGSTPSSARHSKGGAARENATAHGAADPAGSTATTGAQHIITIILLALGTLAVGGVAVAAAIRLRSRGR
ncbi:DUF6801 domain-containing protein [Streptomyces sp. NPDC057555]|uniref:DUF6801 domain-containing protein n=1 Tax=Streptomyces sp. NPDC057555 TaxID=3346166 RepID=UPI00368FE01B